MTSSAVRGAPCDVGSANPHQIERDIKIAQLLALCGQVSRGQRQTDIVTAKTDA